MTLRWGPIAALSGLFGLGAYGLWIAGPGTPERLPPAPVPFAQTPGAPLPTPVPPLPPPEVRPEQPRPARVPAFDVLDVTPQGVVTVAGEVDPFARVQLTANGVVIAETGADAGGRWLIGPTVALAPGTTEFLLRSTLGDGRTATSADTLTVIVPRTTAEGFLATLAAPGREAREIGRVDPVPVVAPSFTEATVEPDGRVTVRGTVDPRAEVRLVVGDREIGSVAADAAGAFVVGPTPPLPPGENRLGLRVRHPDGRQVQSQDALVVEMPRAAGGAFAVRREQPGRAAETLREIAAEPARVPRFETVQVQPNGVAMIQGTVEPGARVALLDGATVLAEAVADPAGRFAIGPTRALEAGARVLTLRTELVDGRSAVSTERLTVAVPSRPEDGFTATLETPDAPPRVLARRDPAPPPPPPPPVFGDIRFEADGAGEIAGRAAPGTRVAIVANGQVNGEAVAGPDGLWRVAPVLPFGLGNTEVRLRAIDAANRATLSDERVTVLRPRLPGEAFGVVVERPGEAPRIIARGEPMPAPPPPPAPPAVVTVLPPPETPPAPAPVAPPPAPAPAAPPPVPAAAPPPAVAVPSPPAVAAPPPPAVAAPPPPAVAAPPPPAEPRVAEAPPAPVVAPRPPVRANVPPPPRRPLPDHRIK